MHLSPPDHLPIPDFAYRHRFAILGIMLIDSVMANLDSSMVNIVLPTITSAFHADLSEAQWIVTAYLLSMSCLFVICGKLSEYTGVCRMFTAGSLLFTVSSLGCGLSADLNQLIALRILQGIGSSMVAGISTVIVFRVFPTHEIGRALGYSGSIISVCAMAGPALGGLINDLWGWEFIFFINVPIGIILFFCNLKYLRIPETLAEKPDIDWIGAVSLIAAIGSFFLACGEIGSEMQVTPGLLLYSGLFVISGIVFVIRETRCTHPLLDLSIFTNTRYIIPVGCGFILTLANFALITLLPFYFEGVMKMTSFEIGILFMVNSVVGIFASSTTGWIIDRYRWRYLAGFGLLIVSVTGFIMGYALIAINFTVILAMFILRGIGASLFQGQKSIEVMNALPAEKAATASSVSTTAGSLGASMGVSFASLLVTLGMNTSGYHGEILSAPASLLSWTIGGTIILTGFACLTGAAASILRNREPLLPGGT